MRIYKWRSRQLSTENSKLEPTQTSLNELHEITIICKCKSTSEMTLTMVYCKYEAEMNTLACVGVDKCAYCVHEILKKHGYRSYTKFTNTQI